MNELANLIVKKTGIPMATALTIVGVVTSYLENKLPPSMSATVKGFLSNDAQVQQAENVVGNLMGKLGKKK